MRKGCKWGGGDDERRECENVEKQVGKLASAATLLLFHPFPQFSLQDIGMARKADPNQFVVYLAFLFTCSTQVTCLPWFRVKLHAVK